MANNIGMNDYSGAVKTVKTTETASVHTPHNNIDSIAAGDNNIGNVDIASAIPSGSNTIGKVDLNAGSNTIGKVDLNAGDNNIGNVDIASAIPAGDNNIGNVDIASAIPAGSNTIGKVDLNAGTNLLGYVTNYQECGTVNIGGTTYTVKRSLFDTINNLPYSGGVVISGVTSKIIRILAADIHYVAIDPVTGGVNRLRFYEDTTSLPVISDRYLPSNTQVYDFNLSLNIYGWGQTNVPGKGLYVALPAFGSIDGASGNITYIEV